MNKSVFCKAKKFISSFDGLRTIAGVIIIAGASLVISACSNDEKFNDEASKYKNSVINVGTSIGYSDGLTTRAFADDEHEALKTGTKLRLKVSGKWVGHDPNPVVLYPVGTAAAEVSNSRKNVINFDASNQFYWDDFGTGDPANQGDGNGRAEGLSIFAVGINNGVTAAPNPGTGVNDWTNLTWTIQTDGTNVLTKDLIFSNQITTTDNKYKYDRDRNKPIQLDMQHAMSMVTVKITAGVGFPESGTGLIGSSTHKFETDPVFTLTSNGYASSTNTIPEYAISTGSINIEEGTISPSQNDDDKKAVKAQTISNNDTEESDVTKKWTVLKQALIYPNSQLARTQNSDIVAKIEIDGNEYDVTAEKMRTIMTKTDGHNSEYTKAGYNYIFNIKVEKTGIKVEASVEKWKNVEAAEQLAEIKFDPDVKTSDITNPGVALTTDGSAFNLYSYASNASISGLPTNPSTVATYQTATTAKWTYSPQLYWQSKNDTRKFRALAKYDDASVDEDYPKTAVYDNLSIEQHGGTDGDVDVLWGTTPAHTNHDNANDTYSKGGVITPRTGTVPIEFYHAKSKITIELKTVDTENDVLTPWVNMAGAKVTVKNIYTKGTINFDTGVITASTSGNLPSSTPDATATIKTDNHLEATTSITGWMVIPQTIPESAVVEIVLADPDNTKYSIKLQDCVKTGTTDKILIWESGVHYKYTIKLTKETIQMSAYVQKWTETSGSGEADIIWD